MCWSRTALLLLVFAGEAIADQGDFVLAGGVEADSADGLAIAAMGDYAVGNATWLSASLARNTADLSRNLELQTWYADVGVDHWFDPVGIRAGLSYWGDHDILDSRDGLLSAYWRGKTAMFSVDYQRRDFDLNVPETQFFPGRSIEFSADGIGASASFALGSKADLSLNAMSYDYSVNLAIDEYRPLLDLLGVSRLGLLNSLVDYRLSVSLGADAGDSRWSLNLASWKGAVDQGQTHSLTLRFLTPVGDRHDIEFGLGRDSSESFGDVTFFSVFLYFYGGS